jgi:large subunit ribosomal protein L21
MFAIIKTGGKQYKVAANDIIKIEKLEATSGDSVEFADVLMMGKEGAVKLGSPLLSSARVHGTVLEQIRDDKVIIFKKNRRHNYRRKNGHRQYLTVVRITDLLEDGTKGTPKKAGAPAPVKEKAPKAAPKAAQPAPKADLKAKKTPAEPVKKATPKAKKAPKS